MEMNLAGSMAIDHFVQLKLPWMLTATIDAYRSGDAVERARALRWIESTVAGKSVEQADSDANNWWRAELLYSLAYLLAQA